MDMEQVYRALTVLRAPLQRGEYDLHRLVGETLAAAGIAGCCPNWPATVPVRKWRA